MQDILPTGCRVTDYAGYLRGDSLLRGVITAGMRRNHTVATSHLH